MMTHSGMSGSEGVVYPIPPGWMTDLFSSRIFPGQGPAKMTMGNWRQPEPRPRRGRSTAKTPLLANQKVERRIRAHHSDSAEAEGGSSRWLRSLLEGGAELLLLLVGGLLALLRGGWRRGHQDEENEQTHAAAPGTGPQADAAGQAGDDALASLAQTLAATPPWGGQAPDPHDVWLYEKTGQLVARDHELPDEAYLDQAASLRALFSPGENPPEEPAPDSRP